MSTPRCITIVFKSRKRREEEQQEESRRREEERRRTTRKTRTTRTTRTTTRGIQVSHDIYNRLIEKERRNNKFIFLHILCVL